MSENVDALFLAFQAAVAGRYSLERELGRGGMGVVYLAREVRLDRLVAIKLLPPHLGAQEPLRERFLKEARTAAKLSHPNIVQIFAADEAGDFVFFAMAYVDGETLAQRVAARGPLVPAEASRILRETAWALGHAHAQGVIHRDVKAANILLERESGRALVADFGIARVASGAGETTGGERLGTPEFMSPEQASGEPVDARSDLYSLGVVAYYALSGGLPFTGDTVQAILAKHITQRAPSLASTARGVPRPLVRVVERCLEKDPAARFQAAPALAEALGEATDKRTEVPVPVRVFLDRRRITATFVPAFVVAALVPSVLHDLVTQGALTGVRVALISAEVAALLLLPPLLNLRRMRRLLALGYGPDDLLLALRASFHRRREEFHFEHGLQLSARERAVRGAFWLSLAVGATAVLGIAASAIAGTGIASAWLAAAAIGGYTALVSGLITRKWRRLRDGTGSFWSRFWDGRAGRSFFRVAGIGLQRRAMLADRPTEVAIAMSVEAMFAELPREVRQELGDLPGVLRRLESRAQSLRSGLDQLNASAADAERSRQGIGASQRANIGGELGDLREQAQVRLGEVVTALETLRLDLLRHRIGAGTLEGLTTDLAVARELGEQTDRLLDARSEVERALGRAPSG
jgi:serine/threonine-protein kinase